MKKTLIIGLLTLFSFGLSAQERKSNHVTITPLRSASPVMFAVAVDKAEDGDEAVVDICYWTYFPGVMAKMVRCRTSVVPIFVGVASLSDEVPASMDDIQSVKVRIVRPIEREYFAFKELTP